MAEETQEENYLRAAAVRAPDGSWPEGLAITEIIDGKVQAIVKSRANALRQIKYGLSRYLDSYVKT